MPRSPTLLRLVALVSLAAVGVHELRLWIGFGATDAELIHDEHTFLSLSLSLSAVLACAGLVSFTGALVRARRSGKAPASPHPRFAATWVASSSVLVAVYCGQELLEPMLADGHPGGLGGIFGHAGWSALLLALVFGAVIAWLLRGAHAAIVRAARRGEGRRAVGEARSARSPRLTDRRPGAAVLALHLAGRAPPPTPS